MRKTCRVFIRELEMDWPIGVYAQEQGCSQRLVLNLTLEVREPADPDADDYSQVVCYDTLAGRLQNMAHKGHIKLLETLAHRIALLCLEDERVMQATVRVEKVRPFSKALTVGKMGSVAVEVTRYR